MPSSRRRCPWCCPALQLHRRGCCRGCWSGSASGLFSPQFVGSGSCKPRTWPLHCRIQNNLENLCINIYHERLSMRIASHCWFQLTDRPQKWPESEFYHLSAANPANEMIRLTTWHTALDIWRLRWAFSSHRCPAGAISAELAVAPYGRALGLLVDTWNYKPQLNCRSGLELYVAVKNSKIVILALA